MYGWEFCGGEDCSCDLMCVGCDRKIDFGNVGGYLPRDTN